MDEISKLVQKYNEVEEEQHERLIELFDLLDARKGYRYVRFSGKSDTWSNFWGRERKDLAHETFVKPFVNKVDEIVIGEE